MLPARELLGEMLIEQKQPVAALKELEASQAREPNRYRNYANAALAAEMAGDKAKAREYYTKLVELAKKADGSRPELVKAKAYLARQ
jgi:Tfp pilus assembly protein PilF